MRILAERESAKFDGTRTVVAVDDKRLNAAHRIGKMPDFALKTVRAALFMCAPKEIIGSLITYHIAIIIYDARTGGSVDFDNAPIARQTPTDLDNTQRPCFGLHHNDGGILNGQIRIDSIDFDRNVADLTAKRTKQIDAVNGGIERRTYRIVTRNLCLCVVPQPAESAAKHSRASNVVVGD